MMVSDAMDRSPVTVQSEVPLEDAVALAQQSGAEHLLVLDEQTLVGILCTCDLRDARPGDHVSDRMSVPVMTVRPDAPLEEAAVTMNECALGCLPVAVGGLILGTVTDVELERCGVMPRRRRRTHCARRRLN